MPELTQLLVVLVKAGGFLLHDQRNTKLHQLKQEFRQSSGYIAELQQLGQGRVQRPFHRGV